MGNNIWKCNCLRVWANIFTNQLNQYIIPRLTKESSKTILLVVSSSRKLNRVEMLEAKP